ncbi:MAG: metallophosphoesterase [Tepidisphaeraceae bacterium]
MRPLAGYLKDPKWTNQHRWRRAVWTTMSRLGMTGLHTMPLSRRWVDIHRRDMPLAGLDPAFTGFKIIQISDLHYSPVVWRRYLIQYIRWVNGLEPDLVVVTGDLITGGYRFAERVATILSHIKATHGVVCTFGNHDYSIYGRNGSGEGKRRADHLERSLVKHNLIVLRNQSLELRVDGAASPLVVVGLDDEWSGQIDPDIAFDGVDSSRPIVCLNHNPANCQSLMQYPWQWMLSGHTHGRQVATSRLGRALYPHRFRHYTHGYYAVQGRHLYVNRGLSYGQRGRHWCRPEITVFKLAVRDPD